MEKRKNWIPELDGLRVMMIWIVSWYHIWQQSWLTPYIGSWSLDYLVRSGYIWVDGTVLMSAFLLYRPYVSARMEGERLPDPGQFYRRRARKILPGYLTILALTFFLTFNMPKEMLYDIRDIVMLLPEMAALHNLDKVRNNPVYPLAYEVFRLLTMANGWMADAFAELPLPNDVSQWQEQATREIEEDSLQTQQPKRPRRRRRPAKRKKTAAETPAQPTNDTLDSTDNE